MAAFSSISMLELVFLLAAGLVAAKGSSGPCLGRRCPYQEGPPSSSAPTRDFSASPSTPARPTSSRSAPRSSRPFYFPPQCQALNHDSLHSDPARPLGNNLRREEVVEIKLVIGNKRFVTVAVADKAAASLPHGLRVFTVFCLLPPEHHHHAAWNNDVVERDEEEKTKPMLEDRASVKPRGDVDVDQGMPPRTPLAYKDSQLETGAVVGEERAGRQGQGQG